MGLFKQKNFINVRIETRSRSKELNDIKHNLRHNKSLSDVRKDEQNITYIPQNNKFKGYKNDAYKHLEQKIKSDREQHNERYKKTFKRNLKDRNASYISGVITFSEKQQKLLENGKLDKKNFQKQAIKATQDIAKYLDNTEILYVSFHYTEKSPHVHFHLKNYDEDGKSIKHKYRTKDKLSKLQDIGYERMKQYDNTIERGLYKNTQKTNDHVSLKEYHEKQLSKQVDRYNKKFYNVSKEQNKENISKAKQIKEKVKELNDIKKSIKSDIQNLKMQRQDISESNLDKLEKLEEYDNISNMQKELRELRKQVIYQEKKIKLKQADNDNLSEKYNSLKIEHDAMLQGYERQEKQLDNMKNYDFYKEFYEKSKTYLNLEDERLVESMCENKLQKDKSQNHSITR
ncbi:MAG: plasmid recombination protein [Candidatus Muiribacteriota bacterium]